MQGDIHSAYPEGTTVRPRSGLLLGRGYVPRIERAVAPKTSVVAEVVPKIQHPNIAQANNELIVQKPVVNEGAELKNDTKCIQTSKLESRAGLKIKRRAFPPKPHVTMYIAAIFMFLAGMSVSIEGLLLNKEVQQQSHVLAAKDEAGDESQESSAVPSEEKPKGDYIGSYKVAANLPRIVSIPSIGVKSRILQVGVSLNNEMLTPKNIYDTAWYNGSSKPGEAGAMIIDGHYSGPTTNGVFSKLERLKVGAQIAIERGDGKVFNYEAVRVETKKVADIDMASLLVSVDTARPGLNLITCGGQYNSKNGQFSDRTVVYALQK